MAQATFFEQKSFSPTSLTVVIGIHVALVMAAVAWKVEVIRFVDPPIIVNPIPVPKDPPVREELKTDDTERNVEDVYVPPKPPIAQPTGEQTLTTAPEAERLPPLETATTTIAVPEQVQRIEQTAKAQGDVRALISPEDYPDSARRADATGTVRARLDIGENGRVTGCTVVASSGFAALDSATCRILKQRARFTPAKDSNGQTVADSYTTPKITWRLEGAG